MRSTSEQEHSIYKIYSDNARSQQLTLNKESACQRIDQIILTHYPTYKPSNSFADFEELLNGFIKHVKASNLKRVEELENQLATLQKNTQIVRIEQQNEQVKGRKLRKELEETQQRLKRSEKKTNLKNEEIFQGKERMEKMENEKILREGKIRELNAELEETKAQACRQVNKFRSQSKNTLSENRHLHKEIQFLNRKIQDFQDSLRDQDREIKKAIRKCEELICDKEECEQVIKKLKRREIEYQEEIQAFSRFHQLPPNSHTGQNSCLLTPTTPKKYFTTTSNEYFAVPRDMSPSGNLKSSFTQGFLNQQSAVSVKNPSIYLNSVPANGTWHHIESSQEEHQLHAEVEDLKKNQSTLLDKIIEKDKIIDELHQLAQASVENMTVPQPNQAQERHNRLLVDEEMSEISSH